MDREDILQMLRNELSIHVEAVDTGGYVAVTHQLKLEGEIISEATFYIQDRRC